MLKIKDITQLEKYKQYFTYEDSTSFFLYNSITNPTKQLHIWKINGEIEFVNGEFKAGLKLIEKLKQDNLVEEVAENVKD